MSYKIILLMLLSLTLTNCSSKTNNDFNMDQSVLQIRQFQKKQYSDIEYIKLMKAIVANLQDMGLHIKNIDSAVGIIYAEVQITPKLTSIEYLKKLLTTNIYTRSSVNHWQATVNVDKINAHNNEVRVNFLLKSYNLKGGIIKSVRIEEPEFYQDFFNKLDKSIFLNQNNL